jgi:hypothetical protein
LITAINKLPNTRFGLYGEHSGQWIKFEPDENFFRDTGFMIREMPSPPSSRPLSLINLTEDIFSDA